MEPQDAFVQQAHPEAVDRVRLGGRQPRNELNGTSLENAERQSDEDLVRSERAGLRVHVHDAPLHPDAPDNLSESDVQAPGQEITDGFVARYEKQVVARELAIGVKPHRRQRRAAAAILLFVIAVDHVAHGDLIGGRSKRPLHSSLNRCLKADIGPQGVLCFGDRALNADAQRLQVGSVSRIQRPAVVAVDDL